MKKKKKKKRASEEKDVGNRGGEGSVININCLFAEYLQLL